MSSQKDENPTMTSLNNIKINTKEVRKGHRQVHSMQEFQVKTRKLGNVVVGWHLNYYKQQPRQEKLQWF